MEQRNQQEQLSGGVLWIRPAEKLHKIHRKIPVLESLFNVSGLETCNFVKKWLQQRYFPVNFAKFSKTPILWNIHKQLLLNQVDIRCTFSLLKSVSRRTKSIKNYLRITHECFNKVVVLVKYNITKLQI